MAGLDGLIVAVFLILLAASAAVVGSMIALALLNRLLGPSAVTTKPMEGPALTEKSNLEEALSNWRREREVSDDL
jgi:hypothetical protein